MGRAEGFTYNNYVVGTSAPTATTQVLGRFGWDNAADESDETDEFVCEFIITGSSASDLETKCQAMRAALRTKYQKLSVDWGANNVATYDPAVAQATGWDGKPQLSKLRRRTTDVGYTRGFMFRCRVQVPSNYSDANLSGTPAANGRRTSRVSMRWDATSRRVVTIEGKFHQTPGVLPRAKTTTAAANNPSGPIDDYCVKRLAKIDGSATWTIGLREEADNNTQTELAFRREYYETISGRFVATPMIGYRGTRLRDVVIRGTFFRTYSASYTGGATRSASTNYGDVATGGVAYAVTQLAALTSAQGGALTPGTDCELIHEEATPNDQDDRLDYVLVYRELNFKQSNAAASLDDPEVVNDTIRYVLDYTPLDDSPVPAAGGAGGPNPFAGTPSLEGAAGKPSGTGAPGTLDKSVTPPQNPLGTVERSPGTNVTKPVLLKIFYDAEITKTATSTKLSKWYSIIRPWLLGTWAGALGLGPTYLVGDHFDESMQDNKISATVFAICLPGAVIGYKMDEAVDDHIGMAVDGAFTGTPYEYLVQQELPERRKYRRHVATYKTGGGFDPATLMTQTAIPGYVVLRRSVPQFNQRTTGIQGLNISVQDLTTVSFVEEMIYVARNVGDAIGAVPNGGASGGTGSVEEPKNPGGQ
jgi:hypothetical protein